MTSDLVTPTLPAIVTDRCASSGETKCRNGANIPSSCYSLYKHFFVHLEVTEMMEISFPGRRFSAMPNDGVSVRMTDG